MVALAIALLVLLMLVAAPTSAAAALHVSATPAAAAFPAGSTGIFVVRLEGQGTVLPSLQFEVEGGTLEGVVALNSIGPSTAEGAVHVRRDTPGTVRLTVSFGGATLATSEARFAAMGSVNVRVALESDYNAAARTWRFEVVNASGQVVETLSAGTSGDALRTTVASSALPHGYYTVRQVLGSDTRTSCANGAFYEVAAPVSAATTLLLDGPSADATFTIRPCAALPTDLQVSIPVDVVAPGFGGGVVGEAEVLPAEPPINEVRGARQPGNIPLPPRTGNTALESATALSPLVLVVIVLLLSAPAALALGAARERSKR